MYCTIDRMSDLSERVHYNIPNFPVLASRSCLSVYRNMEAICHWHDDLEFSTVLAGRMMYSVNGKPFEIEAGQGIFINSRQLHSNYSGDGTDCEYCVVLIHPSLLCANDFLREHCINPLTGNGAIEYLILNGDVPWQKEAMGAVVAIHDAFEGVAKAPALIVQSHAYRLASLFLENMPEEEARADHIDQRMGALRNMVGFVQRNYAAKITLSDIADAGGMSKSTCCQIFRQHLKRTPVEYLTRYRLEKGMEELAKPDLSVTEVALAVGFSGPSYFAENFRKELGITPTEFRRRAQ